MAGKNLIPAIPGVLEKPKKVSGVMLTLRKFKGKRQPEPAIYVILSSAEVHQDVTEDVSGFVPMKALVEWALKSGYLK